MASLNQVLDNGVGLFGGVIVAGMIYVFVDSNTGTNESDMFQEGEITTLVLQYIAPLFALTVLSMAG